MKNINKFLPRHFDVETPLKSVEGGSGTFKEILLGVYRGDIYALTNQAGDIIGMGVDTHKTGAEDSMELEIFKKRYMGKPVMMYFEKAFELAYERKVSIDTVNESEDYIEVITGDGEVITILDNRTSKQREVAELPTEVKIAKADLQWPQGGTTQAAIKRYLKEKYGHYLAGGEENQFGAHLVEEDGELYWKVTDIKWGRKV